MPERLDLSNLLRDAVPPAPAFEFSEVRDRVNSRRRRRRFRVTGLGVVVLVALAVAGMSRSSDSRESTVAAVAATSTTTPITTTTTTTTATADAVPPPAAAAPTATTVPADAKSPAATTGPPPPTEAAATSTTAPPATTTTGPACRNSNDERCGAFRWDPVPDNQPTAIEVPQDRVVVKAGQEVTLRGTASDPDSPHVYALVEDWGDQSPTSHADPWWAFKGCATGYGPWDLPPTRPGRMDFATTHVYEHPGTYEAIIGATSYLFNSADERIPGDKHRKCLDPYRGGGRRIVTIIVV